MRTLLPTNSGIPQVDLTARGVDTDGPRISKVNELFEGEFVIR